MIDIYSTGIRSSIVSLDNNVLMQQKQMTSSDSSGVYKSFPQQSTMRVKYRPDNIKPPPPLPERRFF